MTIDPTTWPQWLITLVATPVLAALTTLFVRRLGETDKLKSYLVYGQGRDIDGSPDFFPYIVIQNLSQRRVYVVEVNARYGPFRLGRYEATALYYEDPWDLDFPYAIEPGAVRHLRIQDDQLHRLAERTGFYTMILGRLFGRHRVVIESRTLAGGSTRVGGETAIEYKLRPAWILDPWWRRLTRWIGKFLLPSKAEPPGDFD